MAVGTRWSQDRLLAKVSKAARAAGDGKLVETIERHLAPVAEGISQTIRSSGRGGSHNSDFAKVEHRAWIAGSGRVNAQVGWLNPPADAAERGRGGRLWYQYQDAGFNLFGNANVHIAGVFANIDRRENTLEAVDRALDEFISDIGRELRR